MKSISLIAFLALFSFSLLCYGGNQSGPPVKITYSEALTIPGLMQQMYAQLELDLLKVNGESTQFVIGALVTYDSITYLIFGTPEEWQWFFLMDPGDNDAAYYPEN